MNGCSLKFYSRKLHNYLTFAQNKLKKESGARWENLCSNIRSNKIKCVIMSIEYHTILYKALSNVSFWKFIETGP